MKMLRFAAWLLERAALFTVRIFIAVTFLAGLVTAAARAECAGKDGGVSVVTALHDGEILILDDGRTIKLTGVLTPKRARNGPRATARAGMEKALSALVVGKQVELRLKGRARDRYGRLMAQAYVINGKERVWVQGKLTGDGWARAISSWDSHACAHELLRLEDAARKAGKGLWGKGYFAVRSAEAEAVLMGLVRNYEIVEGQVQNVAEIGGKVYINFGRNYRQDFTAFVSRKSVKRFNNTAAAKTARASAGNTTAQKSGVAKTIDATNSDVTTPNKAASSPATSAKYDFARLKGQRIRVRGWLENYNGPSIRVTHPEQIEIISTQLALP